MPAILIFQKSNEELTLADFSNGLEELLGLSCGLVVDGRRIDPSSAGTEPFESGTIYVDLPELEEDEGKPEVLVDSAPRLDRDETFQALIDEIVEQDAELAPDMNQNSRDILLTFEETPAALEAGSALAYVIAAQTDSGILIRSSDDQEDSIWFADAEEFAEYVFGDDEDEDEDDDEDGEDEEVEDEEEEDEEDDQPRGKR